MKRFGNPSISELEITLEIQRIINEWQPRHMSIASHSLEEGKKSNKLRIFRWIWVGKKGYKTWIEFDPWEEKFIVYWS